MVCQKPLADKFQTVVNFSVLVLAHQTYRKQCKSPIPDLSVVIILPSYAISDFT